uniref:EthD domain-containing protein n=1 Tax=Candidatus Kentrum sp. FM TaxID=2126340 RepID=A0A450S2H6_9GAMM|nr:MAG: EthD domain-containing protein [Candidatus Kentron sp. FM]VFJ49132.1 MAG: EthD domain-containing protein [Candidatus Kentron sp. FM]VFK08368.1 MAG: EthD domain-containing protein [Candidatus Kentron sp. FM]
MIHQHIFASPKPGMSEQAFHRYWIEVHARNYASKIKEIRRYLVGTRVACEGVTEPPVWNGCAEIWLENEAEQLASLQSKAFLEGARKDEPNWAAFWNTLALDTDARFIPEMPFPAEPFGGVKLVTLMKRRGGMPVAEFRARWAEFYAPLLLNVKEVKRYLQCTARDGFYALGEPRFDALHQVWFESVAALESALQSRDYLHAQAHLAEMVEPRHLYSIAMKEHWIIGPALR